MNDLNESIFGTESIHYPLEAKKNRTNITLDKLRTAKRRLEPIVSKTSKNYKYNLTKDDLENTEWAAALIKDIDRLHLLPSSSDGTYDKNEFIVNPVFTQLEILKDTDKTWIVNGDIIKQLIYIYDRLGYLINKITHGELVNQEILALEKPSVTDQDILEDTDLVDETVDDEEIKNVSAQTSEVRSDTQTTDTEKKDEKKMEKKDKKDGTCPCDKKGFQICIIIKCGDDGKLDGACCCTTGEGENKNCTGTCGNVNICVNKCSKCDQKKDNNNNHNGNDKNNKEKGVSFEDEQEVNNLLKFNEYEDNLNRRGENEEDEKKLHPNLEPEETSKMVVENYMMNYDYIGPNNDLIMDLSKYNIKLNRKWTIYKTHDYYNDNIVPNQAVSDLRLRRIKETINLHEKYQDFRKMMINLNLNFPWVIPQDEIVSKRILCYQRVRHYHSKPPIKPESREMLKSLNYSKKQMDYIRMEYSNLDQLLRFFKRIAPLYNYSLEQLRSGKFGGDVSTTKSRYFIHNDQCNINDALFAILRCLFEYKQLKDQLEDERENQLERNNFITEIDY